jgi:lipopolysaccharide biosynthesis protein
MTRPRRLAIFAHREPENTVRPYVVHHLSKLRDECDELVFVSTAPLLSREMEKTRDLATRAFLTDKTGSDFHLWKDALMSVSLERWDELLLTSSSVFGPLAPLRLTLDEMSASPCDFWGMTDDAEPEYHLESYFLVLRAKVLRSPAFRAFFASVQPPKDAGDVLLRYEVGLTRSLQEAGCRADAVAHAKDLVTPRATGSKKQPARSPKRPAAPPVRRVPYVKRDLLRGDPKSPELEPVLAAMKASGYDMKLLEPDKSDAPAGESTKSRSSSVSS